MSTGSDFFQNIAFKNACIPPRHPLKNAHAFQDDQAGLAKTWLTSAPIAQLVEQLICNQ